MAAEERGPPGDFPNYEKHKALCKDFLQQFRTLPARKGERGVAKYEEMLDAVVRKELKTFEVSLDDVQMFDPELAREIAKNAKRFASIFAEAIDDILLPSTTAVLADGGGAATASVEDVLRSTRVQNLGAQLERDADAGGSSSSSSAGGGGAAAAAAGGGAGVDDPLATLAAARSFFPPQMLRSFEVRLAPLSTIKPSSLRQVSAASIGKLVAVRCMVIRASDVKPLIEVATYACDVCGWEAYQEVTNKTFMPLPKCVSEECVRNKVDGKLRMQTRGSKFAKYQELRVQELPDQVPVGHIPRTTTVVCRGEVCRQTSPGDIVTIGGIFLPTPFTGFQAMRAGLVADTYIEAHTITKMKKASAETLAADIEARIHEVVDADPYTTLSRSIAPEIFGLEDVKKALLLQLVGGVTQKQVDGMKTRGDINICLMGDPGVAKSQLLKHIAKLAPRAVYTTGKGSSGVGLTAAVIRDPMTNELTLEGGALVLADMGICCIDEFDKMEEADRTAIHEVMEQQTVSIAKAGITTTLNARTAILAAANPRYGRYNRRADPDAHVALMKNINLPAALLSRFDLMFLLLDEVDADNDKALAAHVTYVHQQEKHPPLEFEPLPPAFIRQYVSVAKHMTPLVPRELAPYIVEAFVDMRAKDKGRAARTGGRSTLTPRQLFSILRMAQALARLEMREDVLQKDVDEAIRLVFVSQASVTEREGGGSGSGAGGDGKPLDSDYISRIYAAVRDRALANRADYVMMTDVEAVASALGFHRRQIDDFVAEYEALGLVTVNPSRTRLELLAINF